MDKIVTRDAMDGDCQLIDVYFLNLCMAAKVISSYRKKHLSLFPLEIDSLLHELQNTYFLWA